MPNFQQTRRVLMANPPRGAFVGPVDALVTQGAGLAFAVSGSRRLLGSYSSYAAEMRGDGSGSPTATINYLGTGPTDLAAITALAASGGGSFAFYTTLYDQSGNGRNLVQASATAQPKYGAGTHGKGCMIFDGSNDYMDTSSWSLAQPYYIWTVAMQDNVGLFGYTFGSQGSTPDFVGKYNAGIYAGAVLTPFPAAQSSNVWYGIRTLFNGASSSITGTDAAPTTGNAGTSGINAGWRVGDRFDLGTPFLGSVAEQIIFTSNPTGLAGWSAFVAEAKTFYGIP